MWTGLLIVSAVAGGCLGLSTTTLGIAALDPTAILAHEDSVLAIDVFIPNGVFSLVSSTVKIGSISIGDKCVEASSELALGSTSPATLVRLLCTVEAISVTGPVTITVTVGSSHDTTQVIVCPTKSAPEVAVAQPNFVSVDGGETIQVVGQHLGFSDADLLEVRIGAEPCVRVTRRNDTLLECVVPKVAEQTNELVSVKTRCGGSTLSAVSVAFLEVRPPSFGVASATPNLGPASGGTKVLVSGFGFREYGVLLACRFGNITVPAQLDIPELGDFDPMNASGVVCISPPLCEGSCQTTHFESVELAVSLNGLEFSNPVVFHYHSVPSVLSIRPAVFPLIGGSTEISVQVHVNQSFLQNGTCKFGSDRISTDTMPAGSNITHHFPHFIEVDAIVTATGATLSFFCIVPPYETFGTFPPLVSLNKQNFFKSSSVLMSYSGSWFVANVSGMPPAPRQLHAIANAGESALLFGGWGQLDQQKNIDGVDFLNDLYLLRTNSRNSFNYPPSDPSAKSADPQYYPSEFAQDVEWVKLTPDLISGEFPVPRAGHAMAVVGDHLFVFGGLTNSNVSYPLHHELSIQGMKITTVELRRDVVKNIYRLTDEFSSRIDHWRVVNVSEVQLLNRTMIQLLDPQFSFDSRAPDSIFDQAIFGSFGYGVAPEVPETERGTFQNGGVFDFTKTRVRTQRYIQRSMTLNDLHIYHISGNRWVPMNCVVGGSVPHERTGHTLVAVDQLLYLFGGWSLETCPQHPLLDTNQTLPCMRSFNDLFTMNVSETLTLEISNSTECNKPFTPEFNAPSPFDPRAMPTAYEVEDRQLNWRQINTLGSIPAERSGHSMSFLEELGALIVFGGQTEIPEQLPSDSRTLSLNDTNDLYAFQIATNTWHAIEVVGHSPPERSWHTATTIEQDIFVFGGKHHAGFLNDAYRLTVGMSKCDDSCLTSIERYPKIASDSSCTFSSEDLFHWASTTAECSTPTEFCCLQNSSSVIWECAADSTECVRAFWVKLDSPILTTPGVRFGGAGVPFSGELFMFGGAAGTLSTGDLNVLNVKHSKWLVQPIPDSLSQANTWTEVFNWGSCLDKCDTLEQFAHTDLDACMTKCEANAKCNYINWHNSTGTCSLQFCPTIPINGGGIESQCHYLQRGFLRTTFPPNTDHKISLDYDNRFLYVLYNPDAESICLPGDTRYHCQTFVPRPAGNEVERARFSRYTVDHALEKERFTFEVEENNARFASEEYRLFKSNNFQRNLASSVRHTIQKAPQDRAPLESPYSVESYLQL